MRLRAMAALVAIGGSLSGCYLVHGSVPDVDAAVPRDARVLPRDARVAIEDARTTIDAHTSIDARTTIDAGGCASTLGVEVRVEPITLDRTRCEVSHADGIAVYAVEPAPADDGIRIRADLCPDADADCRCDIVVSNVGTDLADRVLVPAVGLLSLDVGPSFVSIRQAPSCECLGCPCAYALVFDAADGLIDVGPHVSSELDLSQGEIVCPEPAACVSGTWTLRASGEGGSVDIPAGADREIGVVHVRSVRDVDVFGPCAACATCGSLRASWAAWVRH